MNLLRDLNKIITPDIEENVISKEQVKSLEKIAASELENGSTIEVDKTIPYISVSLSNGKNYSFREYEAIELLDEVPDNISPEDYILAMAATSW